MIRLFHVTKNYGSQTALQDVSLEVEKGELVFITGPSGAGKSTLIRLIIREEEATKGQIIVDKFNLKRLPSRRIPSYRRSIGVVFRTLN